jgi:hypothetical protein
MSLSARISAWHRRLGEILDAFWIFLISLFSQLRAPFQKSHQPIHPQGNTDTQTDNPKQKAAPSDILTETDIPEAETKKKNSEKRTDHFLKWGNFVAQILVFLAASVYGAIAWKQWNIMDKTFVAQNKPTVGINTIQTIYSGRDDKGNIISGMAPTKQMERFVFFAEIKNFGQTSAEGFEPSWALLLNGRDITKIKADIGHDSIIFPGRSMTVFGFVGPPDYLAVVSGQVILELEITVKYKGPDSNYTYCEKGRFQPEVGTFIMTGASCRKK